MVSEGTATQNGPRIAALVDEPESMEGPDVQVRDVHVTFARYKPGIWPRFYTLENLPKSVRPVVETDDGIDVPVHCEIRVQEQPGQLPLIFAHGHQDYICRGENVEAGGAFSRDCELRAEKMALRML